MKCDLEAPHVCTVDPCEEDVSYRVWFGDCESCRTFHGTLFCLGHGMCLGHTAEVRTGGTFVDTAYLRDGSVVDVPENRLLPTRVCDAAGLR